MRRLWMAVMVLCALACLSCNRQQTVGAEGGGLVADVVRSLQVRHGLTNDEARCLREQMLSFPPVASLELRVEQGDPNAHGDFVSQLDRESLMDFTRLLIGCIRGTMVARAVGDTGKDSAQQTCLLDFMLEDDRTIGRIADGLLGDPATMLLDPDDPESVAIALDAMARCGVVASRDD